jgi:hypothetical protein
MRTAGFLILTNMIDPRKLIKSKRLGHYGGGDAMTDRPPTPAAPRPWYRTWRVSFFLLAVGTMLLVALIPAGEPHNITSRNNVQRTALIVLLASSTLLCILLPILFGIRLYRGKTIGTDELTAFLFVSSFILLGLAATAFFVFFAYFTVTWQ